MYYERNYHGEMREGVTIRSLETERVKCLGISDRKLTHGFSVSGLVFASSVGPFRCTFGAYPNGENPCG